MDFAHDNMLSNLRWEEGHDGRMEAYSASSVALYAIYWPPPGQSSAPARMSEIRPGGFIGTESAMKDVTFPYTYQEALDEIYGRIARGF